MIRLATLPLCLLLACGGNEVTSPSTAPRSPAPAPVTDQPVSEPTEKTPAKASKSLTLVAPTSGTNGASGPAEPASAGPVPGAIDPAWLRVDLFPGATVASSGRTARDAAGLFSTQMLLALPEGVTRDACIETLTQAVASAVPSLERKDGENGRVTLTGSNADYAVTLICGEAKGKMSAYLSYRRLRPLPSP